MAPAAISAIAAMMGCPMAKAAFDLYLNATSAVFSFVRGNAIKPLIDGVQSVGALGPLGRA